MRAIIIIICFQGFLTGLCVDTELFRVTLVMPSPTGSLRGFLSGEGFIWVLHYTVNRPFGDSTVKFRHSKEEPIITMNGQPLPKFARSLSNAGWGKYVTDDVGYWWLAFDCCCGSEKSEDSGKVREMCEKMRQALTSARPAALAQAAKDFHRQGYDPEVVVNGWLEALDRIVELTQNVPVTRWYYPYDPNNYEMVEVPD
jgi:hypothetical protein